MVYFLARIGGKVLGVIVGARMGQVPLLVQKYIGVALVPQAGVAIGLIFSLQVIRDWLRILVPIVDMDELEIVYPLVVALNATSEHRLELLYRYGFLCRFFHQDDDIILLQRLNAGKGLSGSINLIKRGKIKWRV